MEGGSAETRSLESAPSEETRQKVVQQKKSKSEWADWTSIDLNVSQRLGDEGEGWGWGFTHAHTNKGQEISRPTISYYSATPLEQVNQWRV